MEIEKPLELLNADGCLIQDGWARHQYWNYDRHLVALPNMMLKEWNRFLIIDRSARWIVLASASQIGGKAVYYISYADLSTGLFLQEKKKIRANNNTRLPMKSDQDDDVGFSCNEMRVAFMRKGNLNNIMLSAPSFGFPNLGKGIDARFELRHNPEKQQYTSANALSKSRKSFLLNEIDTCIPVNGIIRRGEVTEKITEDDGVFAVMDWGRGRFTSKPMTKALFCGMTADSSVGISITTADRCALTIDGVTHVFSGLKIRESKDGLIFEAKGLKVEFALQNAVKNEDMHFGIIAGTCELNDGRKLDLNGIPGIVWQISKNKRQDRRK